MLDLAFTVFLDFLAKLRGKHSESEETPCEDFVPYQPTGKVEMDKRSNSAGAAPVADESPSRRDTP